MLDMQYTYSTSAHSNNADALVDQYTHLYSDSLLTAILIPTPSDFGQTMQLAASRSAPIAISEYEQFDHPDCMKKNVPFELNPLQLQLQEALEGNLLSGATFPLDSEFDLGAHVSTFKLAQARDQKSGAFHTEYCGQLADEDDHLSVSDFQSDVDTLDSDSDDNIDVDGDTVEPCVIRRSLHPTIYEEFTKSGLDWCRYCGVTKGGQTTASFRPGPWGKRTLCNKHGCDYKGYGYADKQSRLDLSSFSRESVQERCRPILQDFCISCFQRDSIHSTRLVQCDGCPRAYHPECYGRPQIYNGEQWFCEASCASNRKVAKIALDLPKRRLPYMTLGHHDRGYAKRDVIVFPERRGSVSADSSPSLKSLRRDSGMDMTLPCGYNLEQGEKPHATRYHPYTRQTA
ncbi:hypothetical protein PhCBS80983_g00030 [Powellomyces hirtus]|uniref:PHD-type domain-containing protein n=1 Tax=Powellomyces hirtus TaxID=109895 RepID=A0A507EFC5_9FUNG|nr:hypothetical protein PhCBS80983_g00030 [Powellomyces hirtus]